jgi:hypothetical protein
LMTSVTDFIDNNFNLRCVLFCSVVVCWSCDSPALSRQKMMPHGRVVPSLHRAVWYAYSEAMWRKKLD